MKIALVSQEYPPETARGGIGSQTYMKAKGLTRLGHEVFVVSRSLDLYRHETMDGGICVIRIPGLEDKLWDMTDSVQWITHSVVVAMEIDALHNRVELDLIDFPEWAAEGYVHLLNRMTHNYIPVVIQLHGPLIMFSNIMGWPEVSSEFYRTGINMESTCVQLADAVYSSSACSAQWVKSYYNPCKEIIPVIHLGVDTNRFAPMKEIKNKRPTIISIGKIVQNKGVEELVSAACNMVHDFPGLQLRLIGQGNDKYINKLCQQADDAGAHDLLEIVGFVEQESLANELCKANVFALPSYYEGGPGFVYLEAMACGLPVIGCSGSGVDEIITSGINGMLVPPKDSHALEQALRTLLSNETLSQRIGLKAREYVLQEADSHHCIKKLEKFYESVCSDSKAEIVEEYKMHVL